MITHYPLPLSLVASRLASYVASGLYLIPCSTPAPLSISCCDGAYHVHVHAGYVVATPRCDRPRGAPVSIVRVQHGMLALHLSDRSVYIPVESYMIPELVGCPAYRVVDRSVVVQCEGRSVVLDHFGNLLVYTSIPCLEARAIGRVIAVERVAGRWRLTLNNLGLEYQFEVN